MNSERLAFGITDKTPENPEIPSGKVFSDAERARRMPARLTLQRKAEAQLTESATVSKHHGLGQHECG